jgi:hypothetical protein
MDKKNYILLSVLLIAAILGSAFLIKGVPFLKRQDSLTVVNEQKYHEANSLLSERKFDEAGALFAALEKDNQNSMYNLAHLKLKKLQITLFEDGDFSKAVSELELILNNPQFPKVVKSRAAENVFTYFFSSNQNPAFYQAIFSSPTFSPLAASSTNQSLYNYAEYGYDLYPTTVFGAAIAYGKLEKLDRDNLEQVQDLRDFMKEFLSNSDNEIKLLGLYTNQEVALINIYTERARTIHKTSKILANPAAPKDIEENLYGALSIAQILKNPFYIFYTTYNYIDYVAGSVILPRQEAQTVIADGTIFEKDNVPELWYRSTIKNVAAWPKERVVGVAKVNPTLGKLIEYYK